MDNDHCRSVGFHAPPRNSDTPSASSLTMANWDTPPIFSSAIEADHAQALFLCQNWSEQSIFDSALTSLVSSTATTGTNSGESNNSFMFRELIGKLSSFGNNNSSSSAGLLPSSSSSPETYFPAAKSRAMGPTPSAVPEISGGFSADGKVPRVESIPLIAAVGSREESTVSQRFSGELSRKRKCVSRGKVRESSVGVLTSTNPKKDCEADTNEPKPKRIKSKEEEPPPKDYIHVRARRGQATDSHSLAERVRREKISARMKLLQDLVPGCTKVTGKALMLDEIINYVQSLQRQVEFLSMKLASVNTRLDFMNIDSLMSNNIKEATKYSSQSRISGHDSSAVQFAGEQYDHSALHPVNLPPPPEQCSQYTPQYPTATFCEDDLQAIVQMGFRHKQHFHGRNQEPF